MAAPVRPATMEGMVDQLWYAVIGSNGDGLASMVRVTRLEVKEIKEAMPRLLTREEHETDRAAEAERKRDQVDRRRLSAREKAMLVATFIGSFGSIAAVIVAVVALKG